MPKVTFLPMNETYECKSGETLLEVALDNGVPLQHACGGFCACTTCHVYVKAGEKNLGEIEDEEQERVVHATGYGLQSRLSCQTKILGDVTVEIQNLDL